MKGQRFLSTFTWLLLALFLAGVTHASNQTPKQGESSVSSPATSVQPVKGVASWYGKEHHGRRTASGEIFDQHDFTAAHRTLPLGAKVVVTNLRNGRSVQVRINDRGPFHKKRIIDLSYGAARAIGIVKLGRAQVALRLMSLPR